MGIVHQDVRVVATKISGGPCVPAGYVSFTGDLPAGVIETSVKWVVGWPQSTASGLLQGSLRVVDEDVFIAGALDWRVMRFVRVGTAEKLSRVSSDVAVTVLGAAPSGTGMTNTHTDRAPESGAQVFGHGHGPAMPAQGLQFTRPELPAQPEGPAGLASTATGGYEGPAQVGEVGIAVPGILVLDVSWSMQADLSRARAALERFRVKLRQHGMVGPNAYLGIVTFADTARTDLELTRIADPTAVVPDLSPRGNGTNFASGFDETLAAFRRGLPLLRTTAEGGKRQVFRPTVYWVGDGENNTGKDWKESLAELKTRSWKPNVFAFGYRDSDPATIKSIADEGLAYFAEAGEDPDTMFEKILEVILKSMISATVTAQGQATDPNALAAVAPVDPKADPATAGLARFDPITSTID